MQKVSRVPVGVTLFLAAVLATAQAKKPQDANWPHWRGPDHNGMARGDGG